MVRPLSAWEGVRALSLSRPWPYAILAAGKRIENRADKRGMPPMCRYRGRLLLHAAKSWDKSAVDWMLKRGLIDRKTGWMLDAQRWNPSLECLTPGAIVGRCRVVAGLRPMADESGRAEDFEVDTLHRYDELDMRWWMGGFGMVLTDVVGVTPFTVRGHQGLWKPPAELVDHLYG